MKYKVLKANSPITVEALEHLANNHGWLFITAIFWRGDFYYYFHHIAA